MKPANRFLTWSAAAALNTLNARRPLDRHGPGSVLSFVAGWPTSDLPLQTIAAQAVGVAWGARRGALRSWAGRLGLAVTAASWAELYRMYERIREVGPILEAALVDELGSDYRTRMVESPEQVRPGWKHSLVPAPRVRRRYVTRADVPYGDAGRRNRIDVWSREDLPTDRRAPVLVQVHGGAWTMGDKDRQAFPLLSHLAERGWVCVSISYRLSPRATWPDHIVDVKRALAWTKANVADHGGDPDWIAITGGSAGGHLSSLAALTPNDPAFQPGFEDADTTVQAAVPFYGAYDWTNRDRLGNTGMVDFVARSVVKRSYAQHFDVFDAASPMSRITADAPPFFVLHGTNDSLIPVEQARHFVELMRKGSDEAVVYGELPGAQHAFDLFGNARTCDTVEAVERFLNVIRAGRGPGRSMS